MDFFPHMPKEKNRKKIKDYFWGFSGVAL